MYTREAWARAVLYGLGNDQPSISTIEWLVAWTKFETSTGSGANYNLLNTTLRMPGSTSFNSVGVQNFRSFSDGVAANVTTLSNGFYPDIYRALRYNDIGVLVNSSAVIDDELQKWGTGRKQSSIIQAMGIGLNDMFNGIAVPKGWSDDGQTLTAPNGFKVVLGFRDYVLGNVWDDDDYPLANEEGSDDLEKSNQDIGKGTHQVFRKSRLEWTQSRGVFKSWLGQEYLWYKDNCNGK